MHDDLWDLFCTKKFGYLPILRDTLTYRVYAYRSDSEYNGTDRRIENNISLHFVEIHFHISLYVPRKKFMWLEHLRTFSPKLKSILFNKGAPNFQPAGFQPAFRCYNEIQGLGAVCMSNFLSKQTPMVFFSNTHVQNSC